MNEELIKLFEGVELSPEFKEKITAIFEAEVEAKAAETETQLKEQYEKIAEEYKEYLLGEFEEKTADYIKEEVIPFVSKYVDYAAKEFVKENEVTVESKIKVELAEAFLSNISEASKTFNVEIPKDGDNAIKALEEKVAKAQERFDNVLDENKQLKEQVEKFNKGKIVEKICEGLSENQIEKLVKVSEKVKYHDDEQFTKAVQDLKESYYPTAGKTLTEEVVLEKAQEKGGKKDYLDFLV